ncbi:hypothetical protein [Gemelliphila palaticanis]|uniref:Enterocin A Immunity n=1 Tax=Gemelliphila palaticanis TaxID=81950 RepID=A0ABX2T127_9BACL|nr:hypothetical protein [Gemella palaticanis]MBF0715184.1 hypothetical protein [Gemella palaticanis]NYS47114.1 hypothetical protein [Gemella palaticanis]
MKQQIEVEKNQFLDLLSKVYSDRENLSEEFLESLIYAGSEINKLKPKEDIRYIVNTFEDSLVVEANRLTANKLKFPEGYNELFKFLSEIKSKYRTRIISYLNIMV